MNPLLLGLLLTAMLATPMELQLALNAGEGVSGQARLCLWGVPLRWVFRTQREKRHVRLLVRGGRVHTGEHQAAAPSSQRAKVWAGMLLRTDKARRLFFGGIRLTRCDAWLRLAWKDAAKTALLAGALASLGACLPEVARLRVTPDFWGEHSAFSLRLGLFLRLGTLAATALLLLAAWAGERKEHPKHREGT